MTKEIIKQLIDLQKKGIEPFMTQYGWEKFWEMIVILEDENEDFWKEVSAS